MGPEQAAIDRCLRAFAAQDYGSCIAKAQLAMQQGASVEVIQLALFSFHRLGRSAECPVIGRSGRISITTGAI